MKIDRIFSLTCIVLSVCLAAQVTFAQSAPAAPATSPASLHAETLKVVEQLQTTLRLPKPAATKPATPATSRAAQPDIFETFESQLAGKTGEIQFQVEDVHDNRQSPSFVLPPRGVRELLGKYDTLIIASCDNPTATYSSDRVLAVSQRQERRGMPNAVESEAARAVAEKPRHELWIFTDDPAAQKWTIGSTHSLTATVAAATLEPTIRKRYVKATLVLTTDPAATTVPSKSK